MSRYILLITIIVSLLAFQCNRESDTNITGTSPGSDESASITLHFNKPAHVSHLVAMAEAVVSAPDMDTMVQQLTVTDSSVTGTIDSIPAGTNRKFEIFVYDEDTTLTYSGEAFSDVPAGSVLTLQIVLYPVDYTGTVIIVGTFAPFPPSDEKVVFLADYTGDDDIYIMNPDGSNITNLTNTINVEERHPRLSPDGRKIVFTRPFNNVLRPFIININGSNVHEVNIHSGHLIGFVDWSPDGNKLVFYSWHDGDADIYVYDFVTNQINRLTENNTTDWAPVWSPTGDWIAYQSDETGYFRLYLIRPDGTDKHLLTNNVGLEERGAEFSPDGAQLAFGARDNSAAWDLFTVNIDGTNQVRLTQTDSINEYHQCWSPDGERLLFTTYVGTNRGLYLYDLNTNNIHELLDTPNGNEDHAFWR